MCSGHKKNITLTVQTDLKLNKWRSRMKERTVGRRAYLLSQITILMYASLTVSTWGNSNKNQGVAHVHVCIWSVCGGVSGSAWVWGSGRCSCRHMIYCTYAKKKRKRTEKNSLQGGTHKSQWRSALIRYFCNLKKVKMRAMVLRKMHALCLMVDLCVLLIQVTDNTEYKKYTQYCTLTKSPD